MTEIPMSRNNPTNKEDTEASIDVQRDGETIVVVCHDRRLDTDEMIVDWSKKIEKLIRENPGKTVLVDFTDVFLMTSYGLQRAIALLFITQELKSPFGFFGMNSYLFDVFKMTRLDEVFNIGSDRAGVLEVIEKRHGGPPFGPSKAIL